MRANWRCLIWNHTLNMGSWMDIFGGMIQSWLLAASRLKNATFVYGINPKVNGCAFIQMCTQYGIHWWAHLFDKIHLHAGTQRHLTVCEEDSIYAIRAKFCALYSENENMIWRKRESTVSFIFMYSPHWPLSSFIKKIQKYFKLFCFSWYTFFDSAVHRATWPSIEH